MNRRELTQKLEGYTGGASFVTQSTLAKFLGVSRYTARRILENVDSVGGRYYFVPDVITALLKK